MRPFCQCGTFFWTICTLLPGLLQSSGDGTLCMELSDDECLYNSTAKSLTCAGNVDLPDNRRDARVLTLCNYPYNDFDVTNILGQYPWLEKFTLMSSNVTHVRGKFPPNNSLKVLNFTDLVIEKIRSHVFSALNSLKTLDLRHNRLNHLHPNVINLVNRLHKLYLQGNEWNCAKNLDWVLYLNASVVQDMQKLKCFKQPYPEKPLKPIATLLSNLRLECPDPCECSLPNVVAIPGDRGGGLQPMIEVNCSGRGLKKYPEALPLNTTTLLLKGNKIENLEALINNKFYRNVVDVYLDNNLITSIDDLEGGHWLLQFRVFSLKGNKLTQVPTYILDNALQRNHNALEIFLGQNPWRCDCLFTPSFQDLLVKYSKLMKDAMDVKCTFIEGNENSLMPIMKLSRSAICRLPNDYSIHILDLINGILASLIVLILGKLAYDYYTFKKTGQLPWIVTKIP
ncbi:swi2 [Carabus blaptoides fortunei]